MSATARLALPLIVPGQAQKEMFHNEALQALDVIVAAAVEEAPLNAPPGSPLVGACYIVGPSPSGDWAGEAHKLAAFTTGGWRFITPRDGMGAYVRSISLFALYRAGAWELGTVRGSSLVLGGAQVVGTRAAAIAAPSGGTTVDSQGRTAIAAILAALRQHGLIAT